MLRESACLKNSSGLPHQQTNKQQQQQKSDILISLTLLGPNPHSDFISSKVAGCRMKVFSDVKTEGCQKHSKLIVGL